MCALNISETNVDFVESNVTIEAFGEPNATESQTFPVVFPWIADLSNISAENYTVDDREYYDIGALFSLKPVHNRSLLFNVTIEDPVTAFVAFSQGQIGSFIDYCIYYN